MKNKENIRKKLKLTQKDMAMILNTSRSQYALYELGLRDLSTNAMIRLNQIERSILSDEVSISKDSKNVEKQELIKNKFLTDVLKDNEFRQIACKRKLDRLKKDYEATCKQIILIDFLSEPTDIKYALHSGAFQILKDKAEKEFNENGPLQILKLRLQEELLQQEELILSRLLNESKATTL
jgi:transcriptional regulator with XRE-family HTH domain